MRGRRLRKIKNRNLALKSYLHSRFFCLYFCAWCPLGGGSSLIQEAAAPPPGWHTAGRRSAPPGTRRELQQGSSITEQLAYWRRHDVTDSGSWCGWRWTCTKKRALLFFCIRTTTALFSAFCHSMTSRVRTRWFVRVFRTHARETLAHTFSVWFSACAKVSRVGTPAPPRQTPLRSFAFRRIRRLAYSAAVVAPRTCVRGGVARSHGDTARDRQ